MHFMALLLLVCGFVSSQSSESSEEMTTEELKELLCEEENKEVADKIMGCFNKVDYTSIAESTKECYPGMEDDLSSETMRQWICDNSVDDIDKADECAEKKIEEAGKGEEEEALFGAVMACITGGVEKKRK